MKKVKSKNTTKKKKKKGFTLIELLAVIVILGLLLAIAVPSVTRYITQSRKKTLTSTVSNYINALVNEVNSLDYTFTKSNTVYAVPIECIAVERGGNNPFGEWHQANDNYWAYVIIQYDDVASTYKYGYTFKDSSGYGLYPTAQEKLNDSGKQISTGLELSRPKNGTITTIAPVDKWNGFVVNSTTNLVVLEAESEGKEGNGTTTCTLAQKGSNYAQVEEEKELNSNKLVSMIKRNNNIITNNPTLTTSSSNTSDANGLYSSNATNSGNPTYYFRGDVANNYVKFAGLTWRIVRINEDGTVRLIMQDTISDSSTDKSKVNKYEDMYYSNSSVIKTVTENWYQKNIADKGYDSYVIKGTFCEQAKVKLDASCVSGNATMVEYQKYTPDFKCANDGNDKGIITSKVGHITYDEVVYAGGYPFETNENYYLSGITYFWTMSPAGFNSKHALGWLYFNGGPVHEAHVYVNNSLRPVINLKADVTATGNGTSSTPYVIDTN